jgi:putative transposase
MKQQSIAGTETSSVTWENMEAWVRAHVQGFIQQVLEEEVSVFLGRQKSQRRGRIDAGAGYRNGHGHPRRLTLSCGTITVQRPRIRGSEGRFESRVLPLFKRKSQAVERVLPELYLHGLAQGDFELALRGLLGEDAPLSGPTIRA